MKPIKIFILFWEKSVGKKFESKNIVLFEFYVRQKYSSSQINDWKVMKI